MTNEEKKSKVAEKLGYKPCQCGNPNCYVPPSGIGLAQQEWLPDYISDDRTRKEMLAVMTREQKKELAHLILKRSDHEMKISVVLTTLDLDQPTFFHLFGKVVGLWE